MEGLYKKDGGARRKDVYSPGHLLLGRKEWQVYITYYLTSIHQEILD